MAQECAYLLAFQMPSLLSDTVRFIVKVDCFAESPVASMFSLALTCLVLADQVAGSLVGVFCLNGTGPVYCTRCSVGGCLHPSWDLPQAPKASGVVLCAT